MDQKGALPWSLAKPQNLAQPDRIELLPALSNI